MLGHGTAARGGTRQRSLDWPGQTGAEQGKSVAEDNSSTPRRALGPLPDDAANTGGRFGFGAFDDDFDGEDDPGEATVVLRRLAMSPLTASSADSAGSPASPEDPLDVESSTPVPPPMPVLPDPEAALPPASGRRFSATTEPLEYAWAAPRRSAASPASPTSPNPAIDPVLPPPPARPTTPPPVTVAMPATPQKAERSDKKRAKKNRKPLLIIVGALTAFALLVSGVVYLLTLNSIGPSGVPSTSATPSALDPLVTAADLGSFGGVTWTETTAINDEARPLCLPSEADGLPAAQRSVARRIASTTDQVAAVVNIVDTYADVASATTAYQLRLSQAGTCPDTVAHITGASSITGLADSANAVRLTVQNEANEYHFLQLSRTGRTVSLIDAVLSTDDVNAAALANASSPSLNRQCNGSEGTCPTSISVEAEVPAAGTPPGWLVEADLPRLTPAAGRWGATDPATTLHLIGSQCEVIDLNAVTGTTAVGQRTFLLADDALAPSGFGVDQAVYSFSTAGAATKLRDKLVKNIESCPDRAPTASIAEGPAIKGTGVDEAKIAGSSYVVTQKTETNTVVFRVAVMTVGDRVVYLLANPSTDFDFSDTDWRQVAVRAGQRVSQS
mgnify:CR=1 FL=1